MKHRRANGLEEAHLVGLNHSLGLGTSFGGDQLVGSLIIPFREFLFVSVRVISWILFISRPNERSTN